MAVFGSCSLALSSSVVVYMTVVSCAFISMECLVIKTQSICRLYCYIHPYIFHLLFSWLSFSHSLPFDSFGAESFFLLSIEHINVKCNQFDGLIFHIGISSLCEIFTSYSLFYDLHHKHFIRSLFALILMVSSVSFRHFICALQHSARKTPFPKLLYAKAVSCFCFCVYRSVALFVSSNWCVNARLLYDFRPRNNDVDFCVLISLSLVL